MPEKKRAKQVLHEALKQLDGWPQTILEDEIKASDGGLDVSPLFQAFWDRIEIPIQRALDHLDDRIDDLENRLFPPAITPEDYG